MSEDVRIGIIGIVIEDASKTDEVNSILHSYAKLFAGRMGLPFREKNLAVITLIAEGTNDEISSFTGKLGRIKGISVKSMMTKVKG